MWGHKVIKQTAISIVKVWKKMTIYLGQDSHFCRQEMDERTLAICAVTFYELPCFMSLGPSQQTRILVFAKPVIQTFLPLFLCFFLSQTCFPTTSSLSTRSLFPPPPASHQSFPGGTRKSRRPEQVVPFQKGNWVKDLYHCSATQTGGTRREQA